MRSQVQNAGRPPRRARPGSSGAQLPDEPAVVWLDRNDFPWWIRQARWEWRCLTCGRSLPDGGRLAVWHVRNGHVLEVRESSVILVGERAVLLDERGRIEGWPA